MGLLTALLGQRHDMQAMHTRHGKDLQQGRSGGLQSLYLEEIQQNYPLAHLFNKAPIVVEAELISIALSFSLAEAVHQCGSSFLARGATQPKPEGCIAR